MRKLIILIIITAFFIACDKDDDPIVFPKSIAEMNAERILSYKVNLVSVNSKHIPSEIQTTFISFTMTQALTGGNAAGGAAAQTNAMMKGMKYIFPVMIVWMARTYPAGLSIYWFVSQIIQIFINLRLNSIRKKIRADKENKKKRK